MLKRPLVVGLALVIPIAAAIALLVTTGEPALLGNVLMLAVSVGIFVGTLSLGDRPAALGDRTAALGDRTAALGDRTAALGRTEALPAPVEGSKLERTGEH